MGAHAGRVETRSECLKSSKIPRFGNGRIQERGARGSRKYAKSLPACYFCSGAVHVSYTNIWDVLESYILARDLREETIESYRRNVSVFCAWYGRSLPKRSLTVKTCNRFLADKQQAGCSWSYRKGLRATLRLLLNHIGRSGKLRSVKAEPLEPEAWTESEVVRLIDAAHTDRWKTIIEFAYYSGLAQADLEKIEKRHIREHLLRWRRSKTGTLIVAWIPPALIERLPAKGKCFERRCSKEWFRKEFHRIVSRAGLEGTFKKLRKSSGTSAEALHPGCGHIHLGNTRRVFEIHYLDQAKALQPLPPALLKKSEGQPG